MLYERYGSAVYGMALHVLNHAELAEEITQDVFLKVWRQPDRWDESLGQLHSWLLTVTRNAAIDQLRRDRRQPTTVPPRTETATPDTIDHGVANDPLWHDGQLLRRLLGELPDEQRRLIELAFFQGFTHSELAERLNLPLGTVKTRLRLGLQKLRRLWEEAHRVLDPSQT